MTFNPRLNFDLIDSGDRKAPSGMITGTSAKS
jgi:hypothetical protein